MTYRFYQRQAPSQSPQTGTTVPCRPVQALTFLPYLLRFLRQGSSLASCLIGQPLADDALQQTISAGNVINTQGHAVTIAEIELGKVAVQMVMAAMLVDALHAALEYRKEAFDGIGVQGLICLGDIFADTVTHKAMGAEVHFQVGVLSGFIGKYAGFALDIGLQDRDQSLGFQIIHNHAAGPAGIAIYQRQYLVLMIVAATFLDSLWLLVEVAADKGFVYFYGATIATKGRKATVAHGFSNTVRHEPRALEGNAQGAMQLVCADTLLAGRDQEDGLQPKAHRNMATLENGPNLHGKRLAALIALVCAYTGTLAAHLADALYTTAMRAYRALRPKAGFYELVSRFFIVKVGLGKYGFGHDVYLLCAGNIASQSGYVKYNIALS